MAESMSNVERVLWRIAELGARCSQHSASGGRGPLWAELEQTIAGLETEIEAARQSVDIAPAQVRTLEGRLTVARKERDRERVRAQECFADAESARRERDRERQKARKAMAVAAEAKTAAAEAKTAADEAKATADESVARVAAAEAATDQALAARDQAMCAFDEADASGERAQNTLHAARARIAELVAALEAVGAERDAAVASGAAASAARDEAVETLTARAENAVVVLPGLALPTPPEGPVTPDVRVSWRPTWSEWARDGAEESAVVVAAAAEVSHGTPVAEIAEVVDVASGTEDEDEVVLDGDAEGGTRRYLNVAATIGQLLPEDLGPLLLAGATVIRREGRLYATVAVTTQPWKATGSDGAQQAQIFSDAGLRVEWRSGAPLAC